VGDIVLAFIASVIGETNAVETGVGVDIETADVVELATKLAVVGGVKVAVGGVKGGLAVVGGEKVEVVK